MSKYFIARSRKYIFIILTVTIFFLITFSKSFSEENVFIIDNVKVEGALDTNFSRDKYINKAFLNSFKILISKILLSRDLNKISNIKLNEVKIVGENRKDADIVISPYPSDHRAVVSKFTLHQ